MNYSKKNTFAINFNSKFIEGCHKWTCHVDSCGSRGVNVALPKYFNIYNKYLI